MTGGGLSPTGAAARARPAGDPLPLDRLPDRPGAVQVRQVTDLEIGDGGVGGAREPHRHDYHELIWVRSGSGTHLVDGCPVPVRAGTVTVIGRGQVHAFERCRSVSAAVVRFGEEAVLGAAARRVSPGWLLAGRGGLSVPVPPGEAPALDALVSALEAEGARGQDRRSGEIEGHLLSVLLLWIERWYDAARADRRPGDDADVQLLRRFAARLEADYAGHHDAAHYARVLRVPAATLSRVLSGLTGRATKELITDRVMLEASRLLRFTDLSVQEIARRVGFPDPLYFSRAFKRQRGLSPQAHRRRARGHESGA